MSRIHLNIVSFDVPHPPDYGGVIDVYYKIKSLHQIGINISLHCFKYGRSESHELEKLVEEIYYYERKKSWKDIFSFLPFIVKSRADVSLLSNLQENNAPILFEGTHCTAFVNHSKLRNRVKWVRMHNVESAYYHQLSRQSRNFFNKLYYKIEAIKLKSYESSLKGISGLLCLSAYDKNYYSNLLNEVKILPVFHEGIQQQDLLQGVEKFALYHGNLSVVENENAVYFLLKVFNDLNYKLIVAGKNPNRMLKERIAEHKNIELKENPSKEELTDLIRLAHLHCLPSLQKTGIKLKLISSLFNGRFVLANTDMLMESHLKEFCFIADSMQEWKESVTNLMKEDFYVETLKMRRGSLKERFDNIKNAKLLAELLDLVQ